MSGMQEEFIRGVRELHKATRPHVNYVKDFERRAKNDPKGCAEEAQREIMHGATELQRAFREAFGMNFEQAFKDTFYLTSDHQPAIKETAATTGLEGARSRRSRLEDFERDKEALLEYHARLVPEDLDELTPEQRRTLYRMMRLTVLATPDGELIAEWCCNESTTPPGSLRIPGR